MKIDHVRKWSADGAGNGDRDVLPRYWGRGCGGGQYAGEGDGNCKICRNGAASFVSSLYLLHPFAPLADFDAWMLHLQVEGRVRR